MDMDEMVRMMMGGGGMMGGMGGAPQRRRRGKDVGHAFSVTLEDLYNGRTASVPREKVILCPTCKGSGSNKPGQSAVCQMCRGQGARIMMRQIGPGMMQQMQVPCDGCQGRGSSIKEQDKCKACRGERTKTVEQPLSVRIEKGMEHEQQIPFPGEGDQSPDYEQPGSIVIVLRQLKHDVFTRDGNNLHITKKLSLAEALCGTHFTIVHLDNTPLQVIVKPEDNIKPGVVKCVKGKGMPIYRQPGRFGELVIEFEVQFPEHLSDESISLLRKVLPPPNTVMEWDEHAVEEAHLSRTPLDEMRKEMEKEDDDDDEEGGQPGVRCAHQ